jgi:hypothetical protein
LILRRIEAPIEESTNGGLEEGVYCRLSFSPSGFCNIGVKSETVQTQNLFKHSKALDNTPVFRNINLRTGAGAFDDLLDPQDADHDQAGLLALRKANQVRSHVSPFAVIDPATHYNLSIQGVFQRAVFYPTRFGDGSYPVWYGCMEQFTTIYETAFHMIREEIDLKDHNRPIERQRLIFKVACTAILIDLTCESLYFPQLTDVSRYSFTQQIGKRVRTEMHPGLLAPSARHRDGINVAVFTPKVLSNPELAEQLVYRLDPASMRLSVLDKTKLVTSIDGRLWF